MNIFEQVIEIYKLGHFDIVVPQSSFISHYLRSDVPYEPHVSNHLLSSLKPGDVFVDVGANVGYYSLCAAAIVGDSGRVFCIEPDRLNVKCLLKSKLINSIA